MLHREGTGDELLFSVYIPYIEVPLLTLCGVKFIIEGILLNQYSGGEIEELCPVPFVIFGIGVGRIVVVVIETSGSSDVDNHTILGREWHPHTQCPVQLCLQDIPRQGGREDGALVA